MAKLIIQAVGFEITDGIENFSREKFAKVTDAFDSYIVEDMTLRLEIDGQDKKATAIVPVKGKDIVVEAIDEDMYRAILEAESKATRQLRKKKEKSQIRSGKAKSFDE